MADYRLFYLRDGRTIGEEDSKPIRMRRQSYMHPGFEAAMPPNYGKDFARSGASKHTPSMGRMRVEMLLDEQIGRTIARENPVRVIPEHRGMTQS